MIERIEEILGRTSGVSRAAYFGSIASRKVDALSDIDLVVRCEGGAANLVVRDFHRTLCVVLYRPFTVGRSPSGRYWFRDVSPFLRLDVSFHGASVFDELIVKGKAYAQPPFAEISLAEASSSEPASTALPDWSDDDFDFAGALRRFHESAKVVRRGGTPRHPLREADAAVREFETAGLRPEVWQLYARSVELLG